MANPGKRIGVYSRFDNKKTKTALITNCPPLLNERIQHECEKNIKTHRTVEQPKDGSHPEYVYTPGQTRLRLHEIYDDIFIYANEEGKTPKNHEKLTPYLVDYISSADVKVKGIIPPKTDVKSVDAYITRDDYAAVKVKEELNGGKRVKSQAAVMGNASAGKRNVPAVDVKRAVLNEIRLKKFLKSQDVDDDIGDEMTEWEGKAKLEWTHLQNHASKGDDAQVQENLVLATKHCNTQMIVAEDLVQRWAKHNGQEKIHLVVKAKLVGNAHFCREILYEIGTQDGFKTQFTFNPFVRTRPLTQAKSYVRIIKELQREDYLKAHKISPLPYQPVRRKAAAAKANTSSVANAAAVMSSLGSALASFFWQTKAAASYAASVIAHGVVAASDAAIRLKK